ncbi:MAG: hypothetical protein ACRC8Y_11075 [Chroococcales cyanobacterium]
MIGVGGRNTWLVCTPTDRQISSILGTCGTGDRIGRIAGVVIDGEILTEGRSAL